MIILFEGVDRSGKTTIAQALSARMGIPYFKNPSERMQKQTGSTRDLTRYAGPFMANFFEQVPVDVILDRHYPSEFAYAQAENRPFDIDVLRYIDDIFAKIGVVIIICYKSEYRDFWDETTPAALVPELFRQYQAFAHWSHNRHIHFLDTTTEDLDRQLQLIESSLSLAI